MGRKWILDEQVNKEKWKSREWSLTIIIRRIQKRHLINQWQYWKWYTSESIVKGNNLRYDQRGIDEKVRHKIISRDYTHKFIIRRGWTQNKKIPDMEPY